MFNTFFGMFQAVLPTKKENSDIIDLTSDDESSEAPSTTPAQETAKSFQSDSVMQCDQRGEPEKVSE